MRVFMSSLLVFLSCSFVVLSAQPIAVENASFELGAEKPEAWHLSGGEGGFLEEGSEGGRSIYVKSIPDSSPGTAWYSKALALENDSIYQLSFDIKRAEGGSGSAVSGPTFCNRDLNAMGTEWKEERSYFMTPSIPLDNRLRLGQWESEGMIAFDNVKVFPVMPVYRMFDSIRLGDGEKIEGNHYHFTAPLSSDRANFSRPLVGHYCGFNQPRWVFAPGSWVHYVHRVGNMNQLSGALEITIGYYREGSLAVEVFSEDEQRWISVGTLDKEGSEKLALPESLFPTQEVSVRLKGVPREDNKIVNLQVYGYAYHAELDQSPGSLVGETHCMAITENDAKVRVNIHGLEEGSQGQQYLRLSVSNLTASPVTLAPQLRRASAQDDAMETEPILLPPAEGDEAPPEVLIRTEFPALPSKKQVLSFSLGDEVRYLAEMEVNVSVLHDAGYGYVLPDSSDSLGLWWAGSGWKVSRTRAVPKEKSAAMRIQLARNESESAQFVLTPQQDIASLRIVTEDLVGKNGKRIPAEAVEVLCVAYVPVTQPTDAVGVIGDWPDPLPPMKSALPLKAHENQPFWITIHADKNFAADTYVGTILVHADGKELRVPLEVEVFDFTLPDTSSCVSAFGFSPQLAFQYHNVESDGDKRQVYEDYLRLLSEYRISIYNPAALDPIQYSWPYTPLWQGGLIVPSPDAPDTNSMYLRDDSETANVSTTYTTHFKVPETRMQLSFVYKTEAPEHAFLLTVLHYDEAGWMSGRNKDIVVVGDGSRQRFETILDDFPQGAQTYTLRLSATRYTEEGRHTGAVYIEELLMTDLASGETLLSENFSIGDEEKLEQLFTPAFDWSAWDVAMTHAFDDLGFTSFSLPVPGMGGGTFHARYEPELLGYHEGTREYQIAFNGWCREAESHLREKGWLDKAYVYWFDEPDPDDYAFVMNGFKKLKDAAPDINRMLTEEINPELIGGPNIWCPVTYNYVEADARLRQKEGDTIWWYICTGPKAPYATLFIDHPGTALRTWLWQTWERDVEGILIWQSNYWTSTAAYPDTPQNPYEDPMGWVTGYSTPAGTRRAWGNGDGRFLYPPESAADGRPSAPVLEPPVSSIRLAMLRDGIEDYEYLVLLRGLIEEYEKNHSAAEAAAYRELLQVPKSISASLTDFTWDPAPIEVRREAVARAIESLTTQ